MNQGTKNMVGRYAQLVASFERAQARGIQPPQHAVDEAARIYSRAQAMFTPTEQAMAMASVNAMKAQYHQQFDMQEAQQSAKTKQYWMDKLSGELTGMTADQMQAAAKGENYGVKGRNPKRRIEAVNKLVESETKRLGKKMDRKTFEDVAESYEGKRRAHGEEVAARYLASKFGENSVAAAKDMVDTYNESGMAIKAGMAELAGYENDHEVKTTDAQHRKAQMASAWIQSAAKHKDSMDSLADNEIPYQDEEGVRGDVARAFAEVEARDTERELDAYQPPEYDIEDTNDEPAYGT